MSFSNFKGLTLSRNEKLSDADLITIAKSLSKKSGELTDQLLHWEFGPIMNMCFDPKASNYLFSKEAVPLHWDGAFYKEPRLLLFYCTESGELGGETIFLNTEDLWEKLTKHEQEECKKISLTYKTQKLAHYGGEITIPLVQSHPDTKKTILRMAEKVETNLNPVTLEINGTDDASSFYNRMISKFNDPQIRYSHKWQKGDLLVCDNYTYLHGRRPLGGNLARSFKRIQIL